MFIMFPGQFAVLNAVPALNCLCCLCQKNAQFLVDVHLRLCYGFVVYVVVLSFIINFWCVLCKFYHSLNILLYIILCGFYLSVELRKVNIQTKLCP